LIKYLEKAKETEKLINVFMLGRCKGEYLMENIISSKNVEVAQLMDIDKFVTTYKSVFYAMTASAESKSAVFSRRVFVEMGDLCELYNRITEKLDIQFKNAGSKVTVNVSFSGERNYSFNNWDDFSKHNWYDTGPITSIIIKWEYHIMMPEYPIPQPHVLVVKISDGLKPEQLLNLVFTGKIENIELLEEELYPVVARVDYINHNLGDELLNIVSEWDQGLKIQSEIERPFVKKLRKNKGKCAWLLSGLMKLLILVLSMLTIDLYILNLPNKELLNISTKQLCVILFLLFMTFILYSATRQFAHFLSSSFFHYIDNRRIYHAFGIDKGDKRIQDKCKEDINKNEHKAIVSFVLGIIVNLICGILSGIIASMIFDMITIR